MNEQLRKPRLRMLMLISSQKLAEKTERLFAESHLPFYFQLRGEGTASSEIMDMLGLGSTAKTITLSVLPKLFADEALRRLERELGLGRPNTGVAFTTAITGISTHAIKLMDESVRKELEEHMEKDINHVSTVSQHSMILAVINQGYSEQVMDAAKEAGAQGGTVLNARQVGGERIQSVFGISIQEEKELVLILAKADAKLAIMKAVGEKCGIHSEARGFVISTPIDGIAGLDTGV